MSPGWRAAALLDGTVAAVTATVRNHMPAGPTRDFYLWCLDPTNPSRGQFLQIFGVNQLVRLTCDLLDGFVDDRKWPELVAHSTPLGVYLTFEVVSDNLAIGVLPPEPRPTAETQRRVLTAFNAAAVDRLCGAQHTGTALLARQRPLTDGLSAFAHSLTGDAQRSLARAWAAEVDEPDLVGEVESDTWALLVANLDSCAHVADRMAGQYCGRLFREGLVNRYLAVSRTLFSSFLAPAELAVLGAQSILVAPTLAYYAIVLSERLYPNRRLASIVDDGSLDESLYDAALLVRLLNDLGTPLLEQPAVRQRVLSTAAWASGGLFRWLVGRADRDVALTRLAKDIRHGEFNVALFRPRHPEADAATQVTQLARAVNFFSALYAVHTARLRDGLAAMTARLGDPMLGRLIAGFVHFHRRLYARDYTTPEGEYAIDRAAA